MNWLKEKVLSSSSRATTSFWGRRALASPLFFAAAGLGLYSLLANQPAYALERKGRGVGIPPSLPNNAAFMWGEAGWTMEKGNEADDLLPNLVPALADKSITKIAFGPSQSAVLTKQNRVFFLNKGSNELNRASNLSNIVDVKASRSGRFIALDNRGRVYTWTEGVNPTQIKSNSKVVKISSGGNHFGILNDRGEALTFGDNNFGQLGHGDLNTRQDPTRVEQFGNNKIVDVACGKNHTLFVTQAGLVYSCGDDRLLQLGHEDTPVTELTAQDTPRQIKNLRKHRINHVVASDDASFAVADEGSIYSWGGGASGVLGDGSVRQVSHVKKLVLHPFSTPILKLDCGASHCAALTKSGDLWLWGANYFGQCGAGNRQRVTKPTLIMTGRPLHNLSLGPANTAVFEDSAEAKFEAAPTNSPPIPANDDSDSGKKKKWWLF